MHFVEVSGTSARCSGLSTESWEVLNGTCGKHQLKFCPPSTRIEGQASNKKYLYISPIMYRYSTQKNDQLTGRNYVTLRQEITRGVGLSKITERALSKACISANNNQLKSWDSGLKVERTGTGFTVNRLYRRPRPDRVPSVSLYHGPPREVMAFINGFVSAVAQTSLISNESEHPHE